VKINCEETVPNEPVDDLIFWQVGGEFPEFFRRSFEAGVELLVPWRGSRRAVGDDAVASNSPRVTKSPGAMPSGALIRGHWRSPAADDDDPVGEAGERRT